MTTSVTPSPQTSWMETPPVSPPLRTLTGKLVTRMPWLDKLANPLQNWVTKLYGQPNTPSYKIKDILNGVWLGHALHPMLIVVPVGSWMSTILLDSVWLSNGDDATAQAADLTLWTGVGGAVLAAATGVTSWVDTDGPERRTGMLHALLNGGALLLNLGSGIARITGLRRTAIALSTTAFAIVVYSSYIGGELSYSSGVGVNHVAWEGGSDDFVPVMNEKDLQPGKLTRVDVAGMPAVLLKDGNAIYAIAATCSHMGGPLNEGKYENGVVYCPWHNSGFLMCDGSVSNSPAVYAQPSFAVRTRNGKIELRRLEHA